MFPDYLEDATAVSYHVNFIKLHRATQYDVDIFFPFTFNFVVFSII